MSPPTSPARAEPARTDVDLLAELHPAADELVAAVHALDPAAVGAALDRAAADYTGPLDPLQALAVLLAGAVAENAPIAQHVVWAIDPPRYARIRAAGMLPCLATAFLGDLYPQEPPRA